MEEEDKLLRVDLLPKDPVEEALTVLVERVVERWRTARWDSLVANGPAWHDRFPTMEFSDVSPDGFAHKDSVVSYFEEFAKKIKAPIRCEVDVKEVLRLTKGDGFSVTTSDGVIEADNVVAATGPFQEPVTPGLVPSDSGIMQIHSNDYRNPGQLPDGGVLVVGRSSWLVSVRGGAWGKCRGTREGGDRCT